MTLPRIDAHHHLWRYDAEEFAWLDDRMAVLRRDFCVTDLQAAMASAQVTSAIAVQARSSLDESRFLLGCAQRSKAICAVVGWVPLTEEAALHAALDEFSVSDAFVGVREITQGKPAGFLCQPAFQRGIAGLTARGLTYDLLLYPEQLREATDLVDAHPRQCFVLDHGAKPRIAAGEYAVWAQDVRELAGRQNVFCKLSGLVTEADWATWSLAGLRPYLDLCVEVFGPSRLMAGSDWPVCLLAAGYGQWWSTLESYFSAFSPCEREQVFGGSAMEAYRLPAEPLASSGGRQ